MHIFLTGEKRIGKTTTIREFLKKTGATADGFVTYWERHSDEERRLYLAPYSAAPEQNERYIVATDKGQDPKDPGRGKGLRFSESTLEAFNTHGTKILENSGKNDYIMMDELGFLETKAPVFRQAVLHRIDGAVPIIGVIKGSKTEFLETIRYHPNVTIREVTAENREEILEWMINKHDR